MPVWVCPRDIAPGHSPQAPRPKSRYLLKDNTTLVKRECILSGKAVTPTPFVKALLISPFAPFGTQGYRLPSILFIRIYAVYLKVNIFFMEKRKKALGVTGFRHPSFVIPDLIGNPEKIRPYVLLDSRVKARE